jgi:hypothetical protein
MDTVWTTVKVRREMLGRVRDALPGLSNSQIMQRALESVLSSEPARPGAAPRRSAAPSRASVVEADGGSDARMAAHRPAPPARPIAGQTTVDEMLASCPNCATTLEQGEMLDGRMSFGCPHCGYVREPS